MKLKEIIEDVDLLVPNGFSNQAKIRWMNQAQRQLFHDYPTFLAKKEIPVTAGNDVYVLPADCQQTKIEIVILDGSEYVYSEVKERPEYRSFTVIDGDMVVYPVPSANGTMFLYYNPTPVDLTADDLESVPAFPEDFQELLVYGCAYRVAQRAMDDFKISSELEARYRNMAFEASKRITRPKRKTTVIHRGWR